MTIASILLLIIGAAATGLLAGLFGIGGGTILVIVLHDIFLSVDINKAIVMHVAIGSSLGVIVFTSLRSFIGHYHRKTVDMLILKKWVLPILAGVVIATFIIGYIPLNGLRLIFATITFIVSIKLLLRLDRVKLGTTMPGQPLHAIYGLIIGILSPIMGIGGGMFCNTIMNLYNQDFRRSVSTAAGVSCLVAITSTIGMMVAGYNHPGLPDFSVGFVNIVAVAIIAPIAAGTTQFGVKLAHTCSAQYLKTIFGIFLLLMSMRFFITAFY